MKLTHAASLIQKAYDGKLGDDLDMPVDVGGAQASILTDRTLVIPGTNEMDDWWRFNLDLSSGDSGRKWHAGFMAHARLLFGFAKAARVKLVLGHSLGAASAQIIACSLGIPGICFASPRPLRGRTKFRGEHRVINVCRNDDTVCHLPFGFLNFRQLGQVHWLSPDEPQEADRHRLADYLRVMRTGRAAPALPDSWG